VKDGVVTLPNTPGLGVDVDPAFLSFSMCRRIDPPECRLRQNGEEASSLDTFFVAMRGLAQQGFVRNQTCLDVT
jgi:hypothetical protein